MSQEYVNNHDVKGLDDRLGRFLKEVYKAGSGNMSRLTDHDQNRLTSYLNAIEAYVDWVVSQPELDLPESTPRQYKLDEVEMIEEVENEMVNDILRLLTVLRTEVRGSQSATSGNGYMKFDVERWIAVVTKIRAYLSAYVGSATPLDFPESSPMNKGISAGQQGVHAVEQ